MQVLSQLMTRALQGAIDACTPGCKTPSQFDTSLLLHLATDRCRRHVSHSFENARPNQHKSGLGHVYLRSQSVDSGQRELFHARGEVEGKGACTEYQSLYRTRSHCYWICVCDLLYTLSRSIDSSTGVPNQPLASSRCHRKTTSPCLPPCSGPTPRALSTTHSLACRAARSSTR